MTLLVDTFALAMRDDQLLRAPGFAIGPHIRTLSSMGTKGCDDTERAALVALLRARPMGLNWFQTMGEIDSRPGALAFWRELSPADSVDDRTSVAVLAEAHRDIAKWQAAGLGFLTFIDNDYPTQLRAIRDMPPVLFHYGTLMANDVGVSVVGSQNASSSGLAATRAIATGLVERGITIVSGLTKGIDTAASAEALEISGRVVAVIGTGIARYYRPRIERSRSASQPRAWLSRSSGQTLDRPGAALRCALSSCPATAARRSWLRPASTPGPAFRPDAPWRTAGR